MTMTNGQTKPVTLAKTAKVLPDLNAIMEQLAALQAENDRLKAKGQRRLTLKVSEKGAVALCGLRRFPTTLYRQEWVQVLEMAEEIKAFINDHSDQLTVKE